MSSIVLQLKALHYYEQYPDFPKNFTPPGLIDPDYKPPYRGTPVLIVISISIGIAIFITVARIIARLSRLGDGLWWDDYFAIAGLIPTIGVSVIQILMYKIGGVGYHAFDLQLSDAFVSYKLAFALVITYMASGFLIKLSIALYLRRTLYDVSTRWALAIRLTVYLIGVPYIVGALLWIFACQPIAAGWDFLLRLTQPYKCLDLVGMLQGTTSTFAAGDLWLLIIPIVLLWRMQQSRARLIGLTCVFLIGGMACFAILGRLSLLREVYRSFDGSWKLFWVSMTIQLELTLGIISSSLPILHVLFLRGRDQNKKACLASRGIRTLNRFRSSVVMDDEKFLRTGHSVYSSRSRRDSIDADELQHRMPIVRRTTSISVEVQQPRPVWASERAAQLFRNTSIVAASPSVKPAKKRTFSPTSSRGSGRG